MHYKEVMILIFKTYLFTSIKPNWLTGVNSIKRELSIDDKQSVYISHHEIIQENTDIL